MATESHDLQVRSHWKNWNDVGESSSSQLSILVGKEELIRQKLPIWDNRSTYHAAAHEFNTLWTAKLIVGIGGSPYLDPASTCRSEAESEEQDPASSIF